MRFQLSPLLRTPSEASVVGASTRIVQRSLQVQPGLPCLSASNRHKIYGPCSSHPYLTRTPRGRVAGPSLGNKNGRKCRRPETYPPEREALSN